MKRKTGIYKIVNIVTGKVYTGSALDIEDRWYKHENMLKHNKHHSIKLQRSYNKYGLENFIFEIIEECEKLLLIEREQYWIDSLNSYNNGYNTCPKAGNSMGRVVSEETRKKLSKASKGRPVSEETKRKIREKRKLQIFSKETKEKISVKAKVKKLSEETKKKIGLKSKGKKHTEKAKKKMSEASRLYWLNVKNKL